MSLGTVGPAGAGQGEVGTWIVDLHDRYQPREEAPRLAREYGGSVRHVYEHVLGGFAFRGTERAAANLARSPRVSSVIADQPVAAVAETLPTGVNRIDGNDAHAAGYAGTGVNVAILDTGVDLDHPDLRVHSSLRANCIDTSKPPDDVHGHGTQVAGTVAARDDTEGVIGVAPGATVVPVKVLDDSGSGSWASVICGINYVTANASSIKVANMSLGGPGSAGSCSVGGLRQAICQSVNAGITYTIAAGNDSKNASGFVPAVFPEVITVSALSDLDGTPTDTGCLGLGRFKDCDEDFASFSNYGSIVDVIAPGVRIYSTDKGGTYSTKSGTSMAAPHVAGVAALVVAANTGISPATLEAHLKATGECPNQAANDGDATCGGQGTWNGDPDGITEPLVNAQRAANTPPGSAGGGDGTGDTTAPTVGITSPEDGGTVSGTVMVTADAADNTGVSKVEFYLDSTLQGTDTSEPYAWSWNTTTSTNGGHTLTATAFDAAGNFVSDSHVVTVANEISTISLTVTGYKVKGVQMADLAWSGATSANVDVIRNDSKVATTANDGSHTDNINSRGGGSHTYQVCEAGTSTCSSEVTITF